MSTISLVDNLELQFLLTGLWRITSSDSMYFQGDHTKVNMISIRKLRAVSIKKVALKYISAGNVKVSFIYNPLVW